MTRPPRAALDVSIRTSTASDEAAVVDLLRRTPPLEVAFVPDEFHAAETGGRLVACARLRPLPGGAFELASVAVEPSFRGSGIGTRLVREVLGLARGPVYALCLVPGFFRRLGFETTDIPMALEEKALGACCAAQAVPMRWEPRRARWARVRERYAEVASGEACSPAGGSYSLEELSRVPAGSHAGLGTGNPVRAARPQPGETVVDLGSGAGVDVFLAAQEVGSRGRAIGVDLTPEMVDRARRLAKEHGHANVEFRQGVLEHLPLPSTIADVVLSNCVINLAADKEAALREAHRVLKPGGRFVASDTLRMESGPDACTCGCAAGAWSEAEWRRGLAEVGFQDVRVDAEAPTGRFGPRVGTVLIRARKPELGKS